MVAFCLTNNAGGDEWKNIFVILNGNKETKEIALPKATFTIVGERGIIDESGLRCITTDKISIEGRTAMILYTNDDITGL